VANLAAAWMTIFAAVHRPVVLDDVTQIAKVHVLGWQTDIEDCCRILFSTG